MMTKKGMGLGDLQTVALILGVAVIAIGIVANILTGLQADQTANSAAYNVTTDGLSSMTTMGSYIPTIALVVASAIIIGVLVKSFFFNK